MCKLSFPSPSHLYLLSIFQFFCIIAGPYGCLDNGINIDQARGGCLSGGGGGVRSRSSNFLNENFHVLDRFTGHHSGFCSASVSLEKIIIELPV